MAHADIAKQKGYNVDNITIGLLFGSASMDQNTHDRDLISITAAGPLSNLSLALTSYIANIIYPTDFLDLMLTVNIYLFVFNILPIYPMDGGQIVRSYSNLSKNRHKSRKIASIISFFSSIALLVYAVSEMYIILTLFGAYFAYLSYKDNPDMFSK
jgi:Zn-dependent protease